MKKTLSYLGLLILSLPALLHAESDLTCKAPNVKDVAIKFVKFQKFGESFDCLEADFVVDISGCAPNGAFALHAPTGDAAIVGVVHRWQDYMKHSGGIMSHFVTKDKIYFAAGRVDNAGYHDDWTFDVDRTTGKAQAVIGKKETSYDCKSAPSQM
ncbi:MAG TPA: hypothetical protein VFX30_09525 [bacterium]|nr:hypothetical protein [bacterium]